MFAGVALLQRDTDLRLAHLVNGGVFYGAVLLLSAYLFSNHFSQLAKSLLIEDAAAKNHDLSLHDELTGLSNRRAFLAIVERELSRMRREGRRAFLAVGDAEMAREVLERARRALEANRLRHEGQTLACTLSFGFAELEAGRNRVMGASAG